jgi:hypothetical protein
VRRLAGAGSRNPAENNNKAEQAPAGSFDFLILGSARRGILLLGNTAEVAAARRLGYRTSPQTEWVSSAAAAPLSARQEGPAYGRMLIWDVEQL